MARVQSRLAKVGLAAQTAKGSAAAAPEFVFGVTGGQVIKAELNEGDVNSTWSGRVQDGHDRTGVTPGAGFDLLVMPNSIGTLLFLLAGNTVNNGYSVSGTDPYTHEFKAGDALSYGTLWAQYGTDFYSLADAKLNELEFSWEGPGSLKARAAILGKTLTFGLAEIPSGGTDERPASGLFRGHGGTFTVDSASALVKSGSIRFTNNVEALHGSDDVEPNDVFEGMVAAEASLTVVPENLNLWRKIVTGSTSGTTPAATPYFGNLSVKFVKDTDTDLTIAISNLKFACEVPEANPEGGPAELALEGMMSAPVSGDPWTITLKNAHADYDPAA